MKAADIRAMRERREAEPAMKLTRFDTGEMYEPVTHEAHHATGKDGGVDFDNSGGEPLATVSMYPSGTHDDTDVLEIDAPLWDALRIVVNDGHAVTIQADGGVAGREALAAALKAYDEAESAFQEACDEANALGVEPRAKDYEYHDDAMNNAASAFAEAARAILGVMGE